MALVVVVGRVALRMFGAVVTGGGGDWVALRIVRNSENGPSPPIAHGDPKSIDFRGNAPT